MSTDEHRTEEFERRLKALLEEDATRVDPHVRSRLARARFAAVEQAGRTSSGFWHVLARSSRAVAPAGAVAAGLLVTLLFFADREPEPRVQLAETPAAFEDLELLADAEAFELLEEWDAGFYEWAASEARDAGASG